MTTVTVDAATAAKLREPNSRVEVRTEDGKLVGEFVPRRDATQADYERAFREVTTEDIERSLASGPSRPFSETIAELRRKYGT
jgi:hypothetical protein